MNLMKYESWDQYESYLLIDMELKLRRDETASLKQQNPEIICTTPTIFEKTEN